MQGVFATLGLKNNEWKDIRAGLTSNINFLSDLKSFDINKISP